MTGLRGPDAESASRPEINNDAWRPGRQPRSSPKDFEIARFFKSGRLPIDSRFSSSQAGGRFGFPGTVRSRARFSGVPTGTATRRRRHPGAGRTPVPGRLVPALRTSTKAAARREREASGARRAASSWIKAQYFAGAKSGLENGLTLDPKNQLAMAVSHFAAGRTDGVATGGPSGANVHGRRRRGPARRRAARAAARRAAPAAAAAMVRAAAFPDRSRPFVVRRLVPGRFVFGRPVERRALAHVGRAGAERGARRARHEGLRRGHGVRQPRARAESQRSGAVEPALVDLRGTARL